VKKYLKEAGVQLILGCVEFCCSEARQGGAYLGAGEDDQARARRTLFALKLRYQ